MSNSTKEKISQLAGSVPSWLSALLCGIAISYLRDIQKTVDAVSIRVYQVETRQAVIESRLNQIDHSN